MILKIHCHIYIHAVGLQFIRLETIEREIICQLLLFNYINFKINKLKLMSKIIIYLKKRKKKDWRVLIGHPQD
jgi:hypothetical protein